jgi:hypothetical protein
MSSILLDKKEYKVELVEETTPPEGVSDGNWFLYVVGEGKNRVKGKISGTLASATKHAEDFAEKLNERAAKGGSYYNPRNTGNQKK